MGSGRKVGCCRDFSDERGWKYFRAIAALLFGAVESKVGMFKEPHGAVSAVCGGGGEPDAHRERESEVVLRYFFPQSLGGQKGLVGIAFR